MKGLSFFSFGCSIEINKEAFLSIKEKVTFEKGDYIGVRKNARVEIGKNCYFNRNLTLVSHNEIIIKDGVTVGPNCCIYDHDHDIHSGGSFISKPIYIEENVWIGANVVILKGVRIGANSVVAAGSVVTKDIPNDTLYIQKRASVFKPL